MTILLSILVAAMGPFAMPVDGGPALCADQPGQVEMAFDPGVGEKSACNATADCDEYSDVSCSGNSSCTAVDRNCNFNQRGYVVCDGSYTYCAEPCPYQCTYFQCRQGCNCPGGIAICIDIETCECDCIWY